MKQLKIAAFALFAIMLSVITFYSFNFVFTVVANHQALDATSLAGLPMIFLMCSLITLLVASYRYVVRKQRNSFFLRQYGLLVSIFSLFGLVFSIVVGTVSYGSFVKDYIFKGYPLLMLIIHSLIFIASTYVTVDSIINIKKGEEKLTRVPWLYGVRSFGLGLVLLFALNRLGAFLLIPYYWSDIDSVYVLPYYIQCLIPALIFLTYIIHEDFLRNRKVTLTLSSIGFGFSLFSMIYMICMSKGNYPLTINSLSAIQLFERLVVYPIDAILLYGFCFILTFLNGLNNATMLVKERKARLLKEQQK